MKKTMLRMSAIVMLNKAMTAENTSFLKTLEQHIAVIQECLKTRCELIEKEHHIKQLEEGLKVMKKDLFDLKEHLNKTFINTILQLRIQPFANNEFIESDRIWTDMLKEFGKNVVDEVKPIDSL